MTEPIEPIGDTSTWRLCPWCRHIGTHDPEDHPLPPSHPDYDAYYDAPDGVLAEDGCRRPPALRARLTEEADRD